MLVLTVAPFCAAVFLLLSSEVKPTNNLGELVSGNPITSSRASDRPHRAMALQGPEELGEQVEEPEDLDDQDASSISPAEEITLPTGPGGDDEPEEALLLPWDRFSSWLHCICVVGFDLELGQAVEVRQKDTGHVKLLNFAAENES